MRINLIYEMNSREYINCILLEQELLRRGYDARILCKTEDYVRSNEASWTVIPNSYNSKDVDFYRYTFNAKNNIIAYPCEQVVNHAIPNYFDHSQENAIKHIPHLCWGEDYYSFIKSLGYDMTDSGITGAVQLDFCRPEFKSFFRSKEELAKEFNLPLAKKWILFVSDFVYASVDMRDFLIKEGGKDEDVIIRRYDYEVEVLDELLGWFERLLKEYDDFVIIYRRHPVETLNESVVNLARRMPDKLFTIADYNIKEWICNCDVITNWNSTAGIECYAAQKDILLLRPSELPPNVGLEDYSFYKEYPRVKTYHQFVEKIMNYDSLNYHNLFCIDEFYSITDTPAFIRVADALEKIINDRKNSEPNNDYDLARRKYLRKDMRYFRSIVKRFYQYIYIKFGIKKIPLLSRKFRVEEWIASANNKKNHEMWSKKIKEILESYYPL